MRTINKVMLLGNLGHDPELRHSREGTPMVRLNVATHHARRTDDGWEESTDWHRVVVFGAPAESCAKHLSKGSPVVVQGRLRHREYTDDRGEKRWITEVLTSDVLFLPRPDRPAGDGPLAPRTAEGAGSLGNADVPF